MPGGGMMRKPSGNPMGGFDRSGGDSMPANPTMRGRFRTAVVPDEAIREWMEDDTSVIIVCDRDDLDRYEDLLDDGDITVLAELETPAVSGMMDGGMRRALRGGMRNQPPMMGGIGGMNRNTDGMRPGGMVNMRPDRMSSGEFDRKVPDAMGGFLPGQIGGRNRNAMRDMRDEEEHDIVVIASWTPEE